MAPVLHDLRYALRQLRNSPVFALSAILTLALGIGANTAVFSVMNAVLLRHLPVPNPEELVYLHVPEGQPDGASNTGDSTTSFSLPVFETLRQDHRAFRDVMAFVPLSISGKVAVRLPGASAEEAQVQMVSGNFFSGLDVQPVRGRVLRLDDETQHQPVAVISYSFWTRRFFRNPSVLGQTIFIKSLPFTIIGIAPEGFQGVGPGVVDDLWIPLQSRVDMNAWGGSPQFATLYGTPNWWCLRLIARLAPGVSAKSATAEANAVFAEAAFIGLGQSDGKRHRPSLQLVSARGLNGLAGDGGGYRNSVLILMALVTLVLFIACTNVTMLLLAKKSLRQREFSLRLALGAGAGRIFRQLLLESALLVFSGAVLAWIFAVASTRALAAWADLEASLQPDLGVLLFTLAVCATASLVFALAPLRQALGRPVSLALRTSSAMAGQTRRGSWAGNTAMAAQIALCFILLVAAGLLLRTLRNYQETDLGMKTQGLLVFGITPPHTQEQAESVIFFRKLLDRLRTLPGVESATVMENRLGSGWSNNNSATVDGVQHTFKEAPLRSNNVGPDYFHVLGVPLLRGREISDADTAGAPGVAVVNETFVKRLLPNTDPLGHNIGSGKNPVTIIGVARDSKYTSVDEEPRPMAYYAYSQSGGAEHLEMEVRSLGNPFNLLPSIRRVLKDMDPNLPLENPQMQQAVFDRSYSWQNLLARLSSFFGVLAAFLVAIGLYGTMAFRVGRRRSEIGVRMAVGASPGQVMWMVLRESLLILGAGLSAAIPFTLLSATVMKSMLYHVPVRDGVTFTGAFVGVLLITLLATLLPARQAAQVQPLEALRSE